MSSGGSPKNSNRSWSGFFGRKRNHRRWSRRCAADCWNVLALGRRLLEISALSPLEFVTRHFENDTVRAGLLFFNGLREVDLRLTGLRSFDSCLARLAPDGADGRRRERQSCPWARCRHH